MVTPWPQTCHTCCHLSDTTRLTATMRLSSSPSVLQFQQSRLEHVVPGLRGGLTTRHCRPFCQRCSLFLAVTDFAFPIGAVPRRSPMQALAAERCDHLLQAFNRVLSSTNHSRRLQTRPRPTHTSRRNWRSPRGFGGTSARFESELRTPRNAPCFPRASVAW